MLRLMISPQGLQIEKGRKGTVIIWFWRNPCCHQTDEVETFIRSSLILISHHINGSFGLYIHKITLVYQVYRFCLCYVTLSIKIFLEVN